MKEIKAAIQESISHDSSVRVTVEASNIYGAMEGIEYEDAVELERGIFDVWGTDDEGNPWRIEVALKGGVK